MLNFVVVTNKNRNRWNREVKINERDRFMWNQPIIINSLVDDG